MKVFKRILIGFGLLLLIGIAGILAWRPILFKVLRYQVPDAVTYKLFPQEFMPPADTAFSFIRGSQQRNDLDTLHVADGENRPVTLKEYIREGKINVFIVIRNDSVLYERYNNGYTDTTLATVFSMSKTMLSVAVGKAIEAKKIKSLDDKVTIYIPELKRNPSFKAITIGHLLSMRSGLEFKDTKGSFLDALFSDEAKYYYTTDMKRELLTLHLEHKPGTVWKYKSIDAILLGWALEKATGKTVAQYFGENIWSEIGTSYTASWGQDHKKGLTNTASRFQATAIDLAKIGRLYLNKGKFNGKQIIPADWVTRSVTLEKKVVPSIKGWQRSAHHYLWWVPQAGVNGDFSAEGMLGQRLYVDPLTHTIIVELAAKGAGNYPYRKISRYLKGLQL